MLTEKDYCDYETCVALEEVGMLLKTQIVRSYAKEGIQTSKIYPNPPSLYEAQKWLREEKQIEINASFDKMEDGWIAFIQRLDHPDLCGTNVFNTIYNTYESALLVSIKEAIEILTNNENE